MLQQRQLVRIGTDLVQQPVHQGRLDLAAEHPGRPRNSRLDLAPCEPGREVLAVVDCLGQPEEQGALTEEV